MYRFHVAFVELLYAATTAEAVELKTATEMVRQLHLIARQMQDLHCHIEKRMRE